MSIILVLCHISSSCRFLFHCKITSARNTQNYYQYMFLTIMFSFFSSSCLQKKCIVWLKKQNLYFSHLLIGHLHTSWCIVLIFLLLFLGLRGFFCLSIKEAMDRVCNDFLFMAVITFIKIHTTRMFTFCLIVLIPHAFFQYFLILFFWFCFKETEYLSLVHTFNMIKILC